MYIRHALLSDLPRMLEIYAYARGFMARTGNPLQWGPTNWPPEALLREDIVQGRSYVCVDEARQELIVGTFCYLYGEDIDATYRVIEAGAWRKGCAYGVVHRIAAMNAKGVGPFCLDWAYEQSGYLRVDTHPDNQVMQHVLRKCGFVHCGIIHVVEDDMPRYAFDRI